MGHEFEGQRLSNQPGHPPHCPDQAAIVGPMPPMRWTIRIGLVFLVLLTAYAAWPLMSLYRLAAAIETRNAAELADSIDLPLLRRSLTEQIIAEYLKLTGKASRLGAVGTSFAVGIGATIA